MKFSMLLSCRRNLLKRLVLVAGLCTIGGALRGYVLFRSITLPWFLLFRAIWERGSLLVAGISVPMVGHLGNMSPPFGVSSGEKSPLRCCIRTRRFERSLYTRAEPHALLYNEWSKRRELDKGSMLHSENSCEHRNKCMAIHRIGKAPGRTTRVQGKTNNMVKLPVWQHR